MILKKSADDVTNRVQVLYHKVGGKRLELRFLKSTHEEMWKCGYWWQSTKEFKKKVKQQINSKQKEELRT